MNKTMIGREDRETIRPLAERYGEIANMAVQNEGLERYRRTIGLERVRPVVLISEVPWGEIRDEALVCTCSEELRGIEGFLRRTLYQWDHFQGDMVVPPVYRTGKRIRSTGLGVDNLLLDLAMRPEFMHQIAARFTEIVEGRCLDRFLQGEIYL